MEVVALGVPAVEVPHHAHGPGVGGPDRKAVSSDSGGLAVLGGEGMGSKNAMEVPVLTPSEEVEVEGRNIDGYGPGAVHRQLSSS